MASSLVKDLRQEGRRLERDSRMLCAAADNIDKGIDTIRFLQRKVDDLTSENTNLRRCIAKVRVHCTLFSPHLTCYLRVCAFVLAVGRMVRCIVQVYGRLPSRRW